MEKIKSLNLKGHLLTAISYMIPIVCGGGFLVAIGMAFGGTNMYSDGLVQGSFTFWDALATMGGAALGLLPLIIAVGIAFSIAGKPGIAPGFVAGLSAIAISAGFIGGILGGYIAGFLVLALIKHIKVPAWIDADGYHSVDFILCHRTGYDLCIRCTDRSIYRMAD